MIPTNAAGLTLQFRKKELYGVQTFLLIGITRRTHVVNAMLMTSAIVGASANGERRIKPAIGDTRPPSLKRLLEQ